MYSDIKQVEFPRKSRSSCAKFLEISLRICQHLTVSYLLLLVLYQFIQSVFEKFHYIIQETVRQSESSAKLIKLAFLPARDIVLQCDVIKLLLDRE